MNFTGHLKVGIATSTALTAGCIMLQSGGRLPLTADPGEMALIFIACLLGSLSPDLDTQSVPSRVFAFFAFIFCLVSLIQREPYPALVVATGFIFIKSLSHRGLTHTYSLPVVLIGSGVVFEIWLLIPFAVGLIVHCKLGDSLSFLRKSNWIKPIRII